MKRVLIHCTVDEVDWLVSKPKPTVYVDAGVVVEIECPLSIR